MKEEKIQIKKSMKNELSSCPFTVNFYHTLSSNAINLSELSAHNCSTIITWPVLTHAHAIIHVLVHTRSFHFYSLIRFLNQLIQ